MLGNALLMFPLAPLALCLVRLISLHSLLLQERFDLAQLFADFRSRRRLTSSDQAGDRCAVLSDWLMGELGDVLTGLVIRQTTPVSYTHLTLPTNREV